MGLKLFYGTLTLLASDAPLLEGSRLVERVRTAPEYRLFSLDDFPAMVEAGGNGVSIEAQIWEVPDARWEAILVDEPPEYYAAAIELEDGRHIESLLAPADHVAARGGVDISSSGSWRAYKRTPDTDPPAR
jgi:allophanate hydrolase